MIKNRSFLMGLGTGIALGALILQLALIGQGASATYDKTLSREELEEQAELLNLKVYDLNEKVMTEEEWTSSKSDGSSTLQGEPDPADDSLEQPADPEVELPEESEEPEEPTSEKTSSADENSDMVTYRVIQGATLNDVADHLSTLHVIQDKAAFLKEAKRQKINTKIQTGTYEFKQNESISSVIQKITAPQ